MLRTTPLSYESAISVLETTVVHERKDLATCMVHTGRHPEHGEIAICISPIGQSFMIQ